MSQTTPGSREHVDSSTLTPIDPYGGSQATSVDTHRRQESAGPRQTHEFLSSGPFPRLSRAFSMPLPSRLGHLQRPRPSEQSLDLTSSNGNPSGFCDTISTEIADSVQMVIQTLLQISPPHLLDPAKEQLSGCILHVPTPSISSLFTSMKLLNYISKHLQPLSMSSPVSSPITYRDEFDVGELLQSMGDALSGIAAESGIDLVIFHGDPGLQDLNIQADECGLLYALTFIARQLLARASRGDVVEIGLRLKPEGDKSPSFGDQGDPDGRKAIRCEFEFKHKLSAEQNTPERRDDIPSCPPLDVENILLRHILGILHAEFSILPPSTDEPALIAQYQLASPVRRAATSSFLQIIPEEDEVRQPFPELRLAREPTIGELLEFAGKLKGRKASFYASTKSSFAHYLTVYLTGWGMDVTHMPSVSGVSTPPLEAGSLSLDKDIPSMEQSRDPKALGISKEAATTLDYTITNSSFVIIDDDVAVLRTRLSEMNAPFFQILQDNRVKRPSLAANHRPKSSSLIRRVVASNPDSTKVISSPVIVYFTSLSKYREVKDMVQAIATSKAGRQPEIIVIPKPAGVRRFLTALYTATTKPLVDPVFFSPIATSPMSPRGHLLSPFLPQTPRSPNAPASPMLVSDLATDISTAPSSPSGTPTPIQTLSSSVGPNDYFEREGSKIAGSTVSGLFIKSPDGKTGILFQPPSKEATSGPISPSKEAIPSASSKKPVIKGTGSHSTIPVATKKAPPKPTNLPEGPSEALSSSSERVGQHEVIPWNLPSTLSDHSNPVFEKGPPTETPSKPAKASIVGVKAKRQVEAVVPPISVLIVEDNSIQRTILSTFMKNKHIAYGIAENGLEAVERWSTGNYHLVLMDIQMPVMDGIEATKKIRELESARHRALSVLTPLSDGINTPTSTTSTESHQPPTPFHSSVIIVALTAQASSQDRVAALAAGCNDFLTKPVKLQWLERKIIEWGSIKALQMWADPEVESTLRKRQQVTAQAVADNLRI
ncbi:ssk1 response regulator receiver, partial [Serendipita sp. 400]